jgi:molybdopterin-biosynthesis enzyme MoeA-like protein
MMSLRLGIWSEESAFSDKLRNIQAERPQVKIGSYPFWRGRLAGCNIMIRGESEKAVNSAGRAVQAMLASCGLEIFNDGIEE